MAKNSKRYNELLKNSKDFKSTDLKEIIEMIKKNSTSKFDESIDVSLRIGLKQSKGGDFNLRTVTQLPAGTGKKVRVAVLCEPDKVDEAKKSGADVAG
ncbi:MAG: 50S ribosomal protein L1, partial [Pelagibacteraceae bacterium]